MNPFVQLKRVVSDLILGRPAKPVPVTTYIVDITKNPSPLTEVQKGGFSPAPPTSPPRGPAPPPPSTPITKRRLPTDVMVVPISNVSKLQHFIDTNKDISFPYLLERLRVAIRDNVSTVKLFEIEKSHQVIHISSNEYETQLNNLMSYFIVVENYELAALCRDTINQHKANVSV